MTWYQFREQFFMTPLYYIHNRWVNPSDRVIIRHPDYPKGQYQDTDTTMLFVLFQMVVDFVEIECAGGCGNAHFETTWQACSRTIRELPFLRWFVISPRNARQGLHHLRWTMKLKDMPSQVTFARDMFTLYTFWKHERPRRQDPWKIYSKMREGKDWKGPLTPQEKKQLYKCQAVEDKYTHQDTKMLNLLIKNRTGMWT